MDDRGWHFALAGWGSRKHCAVELVGLPLVGFAAVNGRVFRIRSHAVAVARGCVAAEHNVADHNQVVGLVVEAEAEGAFLRRVVNQVSSDLVADAQRNGVDAAAVVKAALDVVMDDIAFDAVVAGVEKLFDALASERIVRGNFVPVEAMAGLVFPEAEAFDPCAAQGDADIANVVNVIMRDVVFAALRDQNGGRGPEIGSDVVNVILLDGVSFVEVGGAGFISAQANAAAARAGDFVVDDPVVERGVVKFDAVASEADEAAIFDGTIRDAVHVNGGVSRGEMADVNGFVGVVPLMAVGAVEGKTAEGDVVDEAFWTALETEELGQAWRDDFGFGNIKVIGGEQEDFSFDGVEAPFTGLINAFERVFDAERIVGVDVVGSGRGEDGMLVGFVHASERDDVVGPAKLGEDGNFDVAEVGTILDEIAGVIEVNGFLGKVKFVVRKAAGGQRPGFPISIVRCPGAALHFSVHEELGEIPAAAFLRHIGDPEFAFFAPSFEDVTAGEGNAFVGEGGVGDGMIWRTGVLRSERECFGQFVSSGADEDGDAFGVIKFAGSIASGSEGCERAVRFARVRGCESAGPFVVALAGDEKGVGVGGGGEGGE